MLLTLHALLLAITVQLAHAFTVGIIKFQVCAIQVIFPRAARIRHSYMAFHNFTHCTRQSLSLTEYGYNTSAPLWRLIMFVRHDFLPVRVQIDTCPSFNQGSISAT